jgi:L-lactate dehydrogenase (cytochrome)
MSADPVALPARLGHILCLDDFEAAARRHLPAPVFAYVSGGVERNHSLRANARAFEHNEFVTRVLVDSSKRSSETTLFGQTWSAPFGIAPMGLSALSAYRGDLVLARAAARENVPMIMSGSSLIRMEEVVQANPQAWFQAYLPGAEEEIAALIERVKAAGYETLVVTLDASIAANRETTSARGSRRRCGPAQAHSHDPHDARQQHAQRRDGAVELTTAVVRDNDAVGAAFHGQLRIAHIQDALEHQLARPPRVKACPEVPVMVDSGFRRGTDVLKALALGATFVFVGRPFNYAAAVAGEPGVRKGISLLREEISRDMAMLGVSLCH